MWQNLADTLDTLGGVYEKLTALGKRKHEALVGINMTGLAKILDEEQKLTTEVRKLEQKRLALLKELSKTNTTAIEPTRVNDFYRSAPSHVMTENLIRLHQRLSESVNAATKISNENQFLAKCALDAVQNKLNRLSGATVEPTYSGSGGDIVSHQKKFDFKA
ncbi:MAG: flagellar protein FlgN [Selenomonadaceae bacterium]|nr:flagellar protein FlgN [Selenomonadaceae bacterium]